MKTAIYCKTVSEGVQSFFVSCDGRSHYLFSQGYRKGVKDYFGRGVTVDRALDFSRACGDHAVIRTMEKLPSYIRYVEREYGIEVLRRTVKRGEALRRRHTA